MRIVCPFCGERELGEFTYLGDAKPVRPAASASEDEVFDYVYLRDNVAGQMSEYWYHGGGCRAWLKVTRNTLTHEISAVEPAAGVGARKVGA
ncbi:sarcosine oxidase subunit delta [Mesorhizobium sp. M00.F.Ca.ET.216.01.1.1]|uniref:sarcosine oxidase subunit delta n=1 Tax=Mesorhizobium sp. M00.F.Ca.ET.216.01.1.1 TaxID=2500528 RepID=UPI000FDAF40E|nr:sarcosine oxidase subunit delta [Mesorhizobium sp. M00.F.Ca.ET.216.01.1.1]TGQ34218.1 sarcosine oxidase subunit delta family protein [Mesorhizobium sp. M00.F.Ca.ET.216.01.1.1]TJW43701.1 MAG: sarcosine oxidase subunit delta family protein [Mesorhizobium sp.]